MKSQQEYKGLKIRIYDTGAEAGRAAAETGHHRRRHGQSDPGHRIVAIRFSESIQNRHVRGMVKNNGFPSG